MYRSSSGRYVAMDRERKRVRVCVVVTSEANSSGQGPNTGPAVHSSCNNSKQTGLSGWTQRLKLELLTVDDDGLRGR
ncbi:hypothetical protein BHE90_010040 [Fusarium euwallaceae]|uniref:Uncharacterized protein n=1 Tax=Fusarium euwallaceae TaxID=1147111 RepID=A0A430LIH3_9HYPO|nr:hypothetical protein BHE90_010040 [Fusarium euwallaceae]